MPLRGGEGARTRAAPEPPWCTRTRDTACPRVLVRGLGPFVRASARVNRGRSYGGRVQRGADSSRSAASGRTLVSGHVVPVLGLTGVVAGVSGAGPGALEGRLGKIRRNPELAEYLPVVGLSLVRPDRARYGSASGCGRAASYRRRTIARASAVRPAACRPDPLAIQPGVGDSSSGCAPAGERSTPDASGRQGAPLALDRAEETD